MLLDRSASSPAKIPTSHCVAVRSLSFMEELSKVWPIIGSSSAPISRDTWRLGICRFACVHCCAAFGSPPEQALGSARCGSEGGRLAARAVPGASPRSLEGSAMPRGGACTVTYYFGTQCAIGRQFASAEPPSPRGSSAAEAGGAGGREQKGSRPLTQPERDHRLGPQRRLEADPRCPPPPTTGGCRGTVPGLERAAGDNGPGSNGTGRPFLA